MKNGKKYLGADKGKNIYLSWACFFLDNIFVKMFASIFDFHAFCVASPQ